jgi:hypothetical protein
MDRPTDGSCSHWVGAELRYCREAQGVRYFQVGHRCAVHTPAALAGLPELVAGPGIPAYRTGVEG